MSAKGTDPYQELGGIGRHQEEAVLSAAADCSDPGVHWTDIAMGHSSPYWVRHLPEAPYQGPAEPALGVDAEGFAAYRAHHEAAHAVLGMVAGAHVAWVDLGSGDGGQVATDEHAADPWGKVLSTAGGERASDRWLREAGLWTPLAAWITEVTASSDREAITTAYPSIGFTVEASIDYGVLHQAADELLDRYWPHITTTARQLTSHGRLTGYQIASLTNLPHTTPEHPGAHHQPHPDR